MTFIVADANARVRPSTVYHTVSPNWYDCPGCRVYGVTHTSSTPGAASDDEDSTVDAIFVAFTNHSPS